MPDSPPIDLRFRRDEDFTSLYANNVRFEASLWDLRIIFGLLDQADANAPVVEQHTAMSLAWPTVKIAAFQMIVNIAIHQFQAGPIHLRQDTIPPRPDPSNPGIAANEKPLLEYLAWVHDQFFSDHPYVPPSVDALMKEQQSQAT